jgi:hypothetical protein
MNIKKINTKKHIFFLMCFFIFASTFAQQNIINIEGNSDKLISVELAPVSYIYDMRINNGEIQNFNMLSFYKMHQLNYTELNNTMFGSLCFNGKRKRITVRTCKRFYVSMQYLIS